MSSESLFAQPKRRKGQSEALLDKTLRAWHKDGYLAGDAWSAARGVLRDAARAVDASRADMQAGEITAYSFARVNDLYRQAMAAYRDGSEEVTTVDNLDAFLTSLGSAPVRDE